MKPLARKKDYAANLDSHIPNQQMMRSTFGQVNQHNAFEQTYGDLCDKLHNDSHLEFMDEYAFPNGSVYKGQMQTVEMG